MHRRGFRFVATIDGGGLAPAAPGRRDAAVFGRDAVLQSMRTALAAAEAGTRQMLFVTGDAGVGKSTVLDVFMADTRPGGELLLATAGCVEHYGAGEPYGPLLDALTRLCRESGGSRIVGVLGRCAPTWLAQLPAVQTPARLAAVQRRTAGATRDRMVRELIDAVEMIASQSSLVLTLEDLHWADAPTIDWLASFARRRDPARVLVIGTYRPAETQPAGAGVSAMADALRVKGLCSEVALSGIDTESFTAFVASRHPPAPGAEPLLTELASRLRAHTNGNPLFAAHVLADLAGGGALTQEGGGWTTRGDPKQLVLGIPDDVSRVIAGQLERLEPDLRELLEIASVAGVEFSAAAVAAGAAGDVAGVERTLMRPARAMHFLRAAGTERWPDGTVAERFAFVHSLYREVLFARLPVARRAALHLVIGARLEAAFADRAPEIASSLAVHFEEGGDAMRALVYREQAGRTAARRNALHDAHAHFSRALALLDRQPPSTGRDDREIALRIATGGVLMATRGWGAPDVELMYARARELCGQTGDSPQRFPALWGLWLFYWGRGSLPTAATLADSLLALAEEAKDTGLLLQAYHALWATSFSKGDLRATHDFATKGDAIYDQGRHFPLASVYGNHDAAVCGRVFTARAVTLLGDTVAGVRAADAGVQLARTLGHPFSLTLSLVFAAAVHQFRRDAGATRQHALEAAALAKDQSFGLMLAWANTLEGWATVEHGDRTSGLALVTDGIARARASGSDQFLPHLLGLAAEAHLRTGSADAARAAIREALAVVERTGERFYEAELHRLEGELLLMEGRPPRRDVEAAYSRALAVARRQEASLLELRAAVSLGRMQRGRPAAAARAAIELPLARVTGGSALADVRDALELLT